MRDRLSSFKILLLVFGVPGLVISLYWLITKQDIDPLIQVMIALSSLVAVIIPLVFPKDSKETKALDKRNRRILLNRVDNIWVKGILEKSLHGAALIELGIQEDPQAVTYPWGIRRQATGETIPPGKDMLQIFHEIGMDGSLLILGKPGSGKSTMLFELTRLLINRARDQENEPIPIVFNLSSWQEKQSLDEWLVDQLNGFYRVSKKTGRELVDMDQLLLLLDGLDEVKPAIRDDCVKAINAFREKHLSISVAVCCRSKEYIDLGATLAFEGAVTIQPLTDDQVEDYFIKYGGRISSLMKLVKDDLTLQELARTPLFLSVMTLAFSDKDIEDIIITGDIQTQKKIVFGAYIDRMFERESRFQELRFSKPNTMHWLSWLSRKMIKHNRIPFLIERLQPHWLENKAQQYLHLVSSAVTIWLGFTFYGGFFGGMTIGFWGGLGSGQGFGFFDIFLGRQIGPQKVNGNIMTLDAVTWSWKRSLFNLVIGLWLGSFSGLLLGFVGGLNTGMGLEMFSGLIGLLTGGVIGGLIGGLVGGLVCGQINETNIPNQGIWQSIKHAFFIFIGVGSSLGLLFWLLFEPFSALFFGFLFGLSGGLCFGGRGFIQHFILRFILARKNYLPLRLVPFLEHAVDLIFLRRVGGGYIFVHRMLMEHIAEMEVD